jgi:hypothetical protein
MQKLSDTTFLADYNFISVACEKECFQFDSTNIVGQTFLA